MPGRKKKTPTKSRNKKQQDQLKRIVRSNTVGRKPKAVETLTERKRAISNKVFADIRRIRIAWSKGFTDQEIRRELGLTWQSWHLRMTIMKTVPGDESSEASYRKYLARHEKIVSNLQMRLHNLDRIYRHSSQNIAQQSEDDDNEEERTPVVIMRNPELAARTQATMAKIDKELKQAEIDLVDIKQKLGIIEKVPDTIEVHGIFGESNIASAWRKRREREANVIDVTNESEEVNAEEDDEED